ncbi:MAG: hypothetical protein KAH20_10215 [Methylococcales bacterium]|nr:hypothetical protein [Methylococcales bacterium]
MNIFSRQSHILLLVFSLATTIFLSSCSDDKKEISSKTSNLVIEKTDNTKTAQTGSINKNFYDQMSKPIDKPTWVEKNKFKKEFSKDCINRELKNAGNKKVDRQFIEKTCDCIADYMDNNLSDQEAEEFLKDDNHMRALQIRYDSAAYHCIAEADDTEKPKVTRFR